jgi:tRNA (guanine37-N1)-methyltransferase
VRIDIVTIFPEYLAPLGVSLIGKAAQEGILDVRVHDLRDFTHDRHRTVDGSPCGGGPGMVMRPEPWTEALDAIVPRVGPDVLADVVADADVDADISLSGTISVDDVAAASARSADAAAEVPKVRLVVPTPSGRPFTQRVAEELATADHLVFAPARYEGIDRRFIEAASERLHVDELSIGDYVLAGGEVAVLVMVEAVGRLLPGVLGNAESARDDSFANGPMAGLLEGPVYTKPAEWDGREVPPILLGGNHAAQARWRRDEALKRTAEMRPDLIAALDPAKTDKKDRALLAVLGWWPNQPGSGDQRGFRFEPDPVAD